MVKRNSSEYFDIWTHVNLILLSFFFRIAETDAEMEARLSQWDKYLETTDVEKQKET